MSPGRRVGSNSSFSLTEVVLHFINIMVRGIIIIRSGGSLGGNAVAFFNEKNLTRKNGRKMFLSVGTCLVN